MSFPFLRLPQVVLSIIVNLAEPNQLICLTQCSKRSYNLVKTYRKKSENVKIVIGGFGNTVEVFLDGTENCRLILDSVYRKQNYVERDYPRTNLFGADFQLALYFSKIWELNWYDPTTDGVLTLIDWTTDLFRTDVSSLRIWNGNVHVHRLKWIESRQGRIDKLNLWAHDYRDKELQCLFHSKAKKLHLRSVPSWFQYPGVLPSGTFFRSSESLWFTLNHLMTSDFIELRIHNSILTNSNVNQFLKHWLAGGSPRLKTLSLEIVGVDINEITRGIGNIFPEEDFRSQEYWTPTGNQLTFKDRIYLKRSDGVIATCCITDYKIHQMLILAVWPDSKNNACLINNF
uniref:F-box domain-containing protein n=1 Tax=Caenorhabditis tropicalis TaxID=1561998 RepID=A0A1I7U6B1_9PELO